MKSDIELTQTHTLGENQVINILERGETFRLLGVWVSTHCNREAQFQQMMITHQIAKIVSQTLCTDKMINVIYHAVDIAKLAYLYTGQCLTSHQVNEIETLGGRIGTLQIAIFIVG